MIELLGFILGLIGSVMYCVRTNTFLFYPGMKYPAMSKLEILFFISGILIFFVKIVVIPLLQIT